VLPLIQPAKLARSLAAFDDTEWLFELKHDGFRAMAYMENGQCRLVSRHRNPYKSFEILCRNLAGLQAKNAILDGEIVSLDAAGRSQFNPLLHRQGQPRFYAFDLLWLDGQDLRELSLVRRKDRLRILIEKMASPAIIYAQHVERHGIRLYQEICKRDLEGIVCKKKASPYSTAGRWLKVMNANYTQHDGRHEMFNRFHERQRERTQRVP
jgi:bifunctional non-homologous end joining protein LigD